MFTFITYGRRRYGDAAWVAAVARDAGFRVYLAEDDDPNYFRVVMPGAVVDGDAYKAAKLVEWLGQKVRGDRSGRPLKVDQNRA